MDNKNIPTWLGAAIIIIFAATALAFVLISENNHRAREVKNNAIYDQSEKRINPSNSNQPQQEEITKTEEATKNNDESSNLEEVSFCGKTYKADQLVINDIDIAKSIANISKEKNWLCNRLELGKFKESGIGIVQKKDSSNINILLIAFINKGNQQEETDPFNQSPDIFKFSFQDHKIYYQDQFTGNFKVLGEIE